MVTFIGAIFSLLALYLLGIFLLSAQRGLKSRYGSAGKGPLPKGLNWRAEYSKQEVLD